MVTAALGGAANESMAVALQRTWPKLLSGGDSDKLAVLNVRMRGLDMVRLVVLCHRGTSTAQEGTKPFVVGCLLSAQISSRPPRLTLPYPYSTVSVSRRASSSLQWPLASSWRGRA